MRHSPLTIGSLLGVGRVHAGIIAHKRDCAFTWPADAGATCASLASEWGLTEAQFASYNPGIVCGSLLVAGQEYCVDWSGTPPALPSTTTTTTTSTTTTTTTTSVAPTTTAPPPNEPQPQQAGLAPNCQRFHLAASGDTCDKIMTTYGTFNLEQLYQWNPAVGSNCAGLWLGYYYCIGIPGTPTTIPQPTGPSPTQAGIAPNCKRHHKVQSGDTCQGIVDKYRTFSLSEFYAWNAAVGTNCGGLWLDYYVCIGIPGTPNTPAQPNRPSPTQANVSPNCNNWYLVAAGDWCQKIADQYSISLSSFYQWNPDVGSSCSSLWGGYYVCVGSS